jgi:hydrogenase maturation protease
MILLIAYGNSLRCDDGAGPILAKQLKILWESEQHPAEHDEYVEYIEVHQLTPELADDIAAKDIEIVIFVDSRLATDSSKKQDVRVEYISADDISLGFGHHLTPTALLMYARLIYGVQLPAWLITVPGVDFRHGEELSEFAQQAIKRFMEQKPCLDNGQLSLSKSR